MPRRRPFRQVDVFTSIAYGGNPVAVVLDAEGLDAASMQRFAAWTNLSETTFFLPAESPVADYRLRIFTPTTELPFAGHPTLGSCHAWLEAGGQPKGATVVMECGAGLVELRRDAAQLRFAAPPPRRTGPLDAAALAQIAAGLGIAREDILDHAWCDNGPPWQAVLLRSAAEVLAARPDPARLPDIDYLGLVGAHAAGECAFEVRAFFPAATRLQEDPVTGSLNAALGQWLIAGGRAPERYVAAQGTRLGRHGRVFVQRDATGQIWVGGNSITCITGEVVLG